MDKKKKEAMVVTNNVTDRRVSLKLNMVKISNHKLSTKSPHYVCLLYYKHKKKLSFFSSSDKKH